MIVDLTIDHALHVCRTMDEVWLAERKAQIEAWDPVAHAISMVQTPGVAYSVIARDGLPVIVGGVHIVRAGLGTTWMAGVPGWRECVIEVARVSRKVIKALLDNGGLHRIQMTTGADSEGARRWCELLGLRLESRLVGFGLHGEDFLMYAATRRI